MRRERPIYKHFDLPVNHLHPTEGHYIPAKAMEADEAQRRSKLPWGTLIAQHQRIGLEVGSSLMYLLEDPKALRFSARLLAASGLNTAWYSFARNADVMRRVLPLTDAAQKNPDWRPNSDQIKRQGIATLDFAASPSQAVASAFENRAAPARTIKFSTAFGRAVGGAAIDFAAIEVGDKVAGNPRISSYVASVMVRDCAKVALQDSRDLLNDIRNYPSLAALADPESLQSAYWRRNLHGESREIFVTSQEIALSNAADRQAVIENQGA